MRGVCRIGLASLALAVLTLCYLPAQASPIGGDPPSRCNTGCPTCATASQGGPGTNCSAQQSCVTGSCFSRTEGNVRETYPVGTVRSANGPQLGLAFTYDSYNADGSRTRLQSVSGFGWTHSYNVFLFSQTSSMFRFDGDGRVTKYQFMGGTKYTPVTGYFETITKNPDGSFTIVDKYGTVSLFQQITGTAFLLGTPVWRLVSITDRNNNVTTLTYGSGNLTTVTDTYGRHYTFSYNTKHIITAVTDPTGRTTDFTYDTTGTLLTGITDPAGNTVQYSYDGLDQIQTKVDKDGRLFTYTYTGNEPSGFSDSTGAGYFSMSNPQDWSINQTELQMLDLRQYTPSTTSVTDGDGRVWRYTYNLDGYVTSAVAPDSAATTYTYDASTLMPSSQTDADGHTTSYTYNTMGDLLSVADALGQVMLYTYEPVYNQMTSMTDPQGRVTTNTYDAHGNRLTETDPLGHTRKWTYDSHGNVLSSTDRNGNTTTNAYDAFGDQTSMTDPLGNTTVMTYDGVGNLTSVTDANGHETKYSYDQLDRLTSETDPLGHTATTIYDGQGDRIQVIDRVGNATQYQYDQRHRPTQTTDALGNATHETYDANNNVLTRTDQDGHATSSFYDVENRLIKVTDALGDSMGWTYDAAGNTLSETDANGHTTTNTYDALNRLTTVTDALGHVTTTIYDGTGPNTGPCAGVCTGPTLGSTLASEIIDADGNATYLKYDGDDRRIQEVEKQGSASDVEPPSPSDAVTSMTYDPVGNLLTRTEPDGNTTTNQYDADNRQIKVTDAAGDVTTTVYDGVGNVISTTAPQGDVTNTAYDADDRVITVTDSLGAVSGSTYDREGHPLTRTDGNGNTTTAAYDGVYRIIQVTDPLGQTITTTYDPVGNALSSTDRDGNTTTDAYDAVNRRTSMTDALGHTTGYRYDPVGNLIALADANGHTTSYAYDAVNRPAKETYADTTSRTYAYDAVGNFTSRTDQNGVTTSYGYSELYFLTTRTYPSTTDTMTYDLSGRLLSATHGAWTDDFAYDGADRITSSNQNGETVGYSYVVPAVSTRTVTYPGGRTITESFDLRMRLKQIDDGASPPPIAVYTYDLADRATTLTHRNGTVSSYIYNADDWMTEVQHTKSGPFAQFAYTYDNEGNKKDESKPNDATHSEAYQYDATYRLIDYRVGTLVGSTIATPSTESQYTLDPVGNWNKKVTIAGSTTTENRTHNAVNEITLDNTTTYTYDNDGNLLNDGKYAYAYDEENRLIKTTRISDSAIVGQYQYDALSRRVQKIADPAGTSVTTRYFYDGPRAIEEQDGLAHTQATYVFGIMLDDAVEMDRSGTSYYYHQNQLGSIEAVTNSTGTVVESYAYDAYGLPSISNGGGPVPANAWGAPHSDIGNPLMFTGRQIDEETGLYYYRARFYDDLKGRFLQRDPEEYQDNVDLYSYVGDRPTLDVDPLGRQVWTRIRFWHNKVGNPYYLGVAYPVARFDVNEAVACNQDAGYSKGGRAIDNTAAVNSQIAETIAGVAVVRKKPMTCEPNGDPGVETTVAAAVAHKKSSIWKNLKDGFDKGKDIGSAVGTLFGPEAEPFFKWGGAIYGTGVGFYLWAYDFDDFTASAVITFNTCCRCCTGGVFKPGVFPWDSSVKLNTSTSEIAVAISQDAMSECDQRKGRMIYVRNASLGSAAKATNPNNEAWYDTQVVPQPLHSEWRPSGQ